MKKVKLGDLGKIITGNTPSKKTLEFYDSNDIPFIKPDDFKTIDEISSSKGNKNYVSENARNSARIVPKNSVLVTCIGIIGKVMISESELSFNQQINAIVPNELILSKYLAYLLLYNKPKLDFISNAPVVPIINKTQFSEFEVTFHKDIDIQEKIIQNLENLDNQILKRRHQSRLLLNLVKSRFNEMFEEYPDSVFLDTYIKELRAGKSLAGEENNKNKVLKTGAVSYDYFNSSEVKNLPIDYIPLDEHKVEIGDVIISRMNTSELVGAAGYVWTINNDNIYLPDRLWKVVLNDRVNPVFLWKLITNEITKLKIKRIASGTSGSMKNISKSKFLQIRVPLPPLSLQNEFADFVAQVDKSQLAIQKSLEELETLKKSLMQEYFG